jgi:hypothetical protein
MFTIPDGGDAATQLPPIGPVGPNPNGWFADCNPAQGFAGTRPLAEHFNEQVMNNRALLARAGITPVKGDATMLWRAILALGIIWTSVTVNVSPTGTPNPPDPLAGDAFDSLQSALTYLSRYHIAASAAVVIQLASGTYSQAAMTSVAHPDGMRIYVRGNGQNATILNCSTGGIQVVGSLGELSDLTIQGNGSAGDSRLGLWVLAGGYAGVGNLTCRGFATSGISLGGSASVNIGAGATVTVANNGETGVVQREGSTIYGGAGSTLEAQNNGVNQLVMDGISEAVIDTIHTTGGSGSGVVLDGGSQLVARRLGVDVCGLPTQAVAVLNGSRLISVNSIVGDFWTWNVQANQPQSFYAVGYGFIRSAAALALNNRANTSPALNTLGNIQAYIWAT